MLLANYLTINIFGLLILLLIYVNIRRSNHNYLLKERLFLYLLASNALILILDSCTWILDGNPSGWAHPVDLGIVSVYYALNPLPCLLWSLYADYQIHHSEQRMYQLWRFLTIPALTVIILASASPFTNWLFYFDAANVYHRGTMFLLVPLVCYAYLIFTFVEILLNKSRIKTEEFIALLIFAIPPSIGGVLQAMYYGLSLLWISVTLSLLIIFIYVQNKQLAVDHLTGLYNRRQLDTFLSEHEKSRTSDSRKLLAGIMIDLDRFKSINDLYGHATGDQALEETNQILRSSLRKDDFISRWGGDEFAAFMEIDQPEDLPRAIARIQDDLEHFNKSSGLPYQLGFSMGFDIYDPHSGMSLHQFLKHIDQKMYADKESKQYT